METRKFLGPLVILCVPHTDWHLLIFIVGVKPLKFSTCLPWGLCGIFLLKLFSFLAYNSLDKGDERKAAEGLARFGSGFGTARRAALTEAMHLPLPWGPRSCGRGGTR